MINYDYHLTRDLYKSLEEKDPHAELKGPLKNIFTVSGKNGSGKSLLMNILAMSSFGYENSSVPQSLRDDMAEYLNGISTKLTFNVEITSPNSDVIIRAEHNLEDGQNVRVMDSTDGGKTFNSLSASDFSKKYNLIYDIPENPRKRITDIVTSARELQINCKEQMDSVSRRVEDYLEDIRIKSVDSQKLSDYKADVESYDRSKKQEESDFDRRYAEYESIVKYYYARKITQLKNETERLKTDYERIQRAEKAKATRPDEIKHKYDMKKNEVKNSLNFIRIKIDDLAGPVRILKNGNVSRYYTMLKQWDVEQILASRTIDKKWLQIAREIQAITDAYESETDTKLLQVITNLLNAIRNYQGQGLEVDGIGDIDQLFATLENQYANMKGQSDKETAKTISAAMKDIVGKIASVSYSLSSLGDEPVVEGLQKFCDEEKIKRAERKWRDSKAEFEDTIEKARQLKIDLQNAPLIIRSTDNRYRERYDSQIELAKSDADEIYSKYKIDKEKYQQIGREVERKRLKIEEWDNQEPSEYAIHQSSLSLIASEIEKIRKNLYEVSKRFKAIESKAYGGYPEDDHFFEILWKYLGRRLSVVRYNDTEYDVETVNAINEVIMTKDGTRLTMRMFSTGLNQRNYLLTKLNTEDNRPIIALFDEISTMDEFVQKDILDKMVDLQAQKKLIVGMMNKPGEKMEAKGYGL